jgi:hypothetical protein
VLLSLLAILLVWVFDANLTSLIQLYVVGVFTAFTLSQSGMVRRWVRLREPGWRRAAAVNAIGAVATGIVLVIAGVTKFAGGAWIVLTGMPILVTLFLLIHRHYAAVRRELNRGRIRFGDPLRNRVVLVITEVDAAAAEALGYVRSLRPSDFVAVYAGSGDRTEAELAWGELAPSGPRLEFLGPGDPVTAVVRRIRETSRDLDEFVTVVVPELFRKRSILYAIRRPTFRLKLRLLSEPGVVVTDVPVLAEDGLPTGVDGRPLIPERVVALVFVAAAHDASIRAINYARSLNAAETRAVFLATEPEETPDVLERWAAHGIAVQLDVVEAPFRDLGPPLLEEVRRATSVPGTVAAVVVPEYLVTRWWHRFLHNNRALFIKRMLLFEPRVVLSSVPYKLGGSREEDDGSRRRAGTGA